MSWDWMINGFGLGVWWMENDGDAAVLTVAIGPFMLFFMWGEDAA